MTDTGFSVADADRARLAALYVPDPATATAVAPSGVDAISASRPQLLAGGHGLVSTAADYHRFTQMLLRRGELDGVRLLAPRTVDLMAANHLPGNADLDRVRAAAARPRRLQRGVGFGLGFSLSSTRSQPRRCRRPASTGGGAPRDRVLGRPGRGHDRALPHPGLFGSDDAWMGMRPLVYQALVGD